MMACQEHLARTIAATTGMASNAASALEQLDRRRALGEDVGRCWRHVRLRQA
jgi:bacterioferritin-associated ferredoxin